MRPFELTIDDEIFLETYNDINANRKWPCGAFHYQATFYQKLTRTEEDILGEWLSYNCKNNFVYYREVNTMIAGGYGDNKVAWKHRRRNSIRRDPLTTYTIRLDREDIWLFRMVWAS